MKLKYNYLFLINTFITVQLNAENLYHTDLAKVFSQGQKAALGILEQTPPEMIDFDTLPEPQFRKRLREFYTPENHQALINEAKYAPIKIIQQNPNGACAQTGKNPRAAIQISRLACFGHINSVGDAARLLIGEYVHHLGKGDEFTDWVKLIVMETWKKWQPDEYQELFTISPQPYVVSEVNLSQLSGVVLFETNITKPGIFAFTRGREIFFDHHPQLGPSIKVKRITSGRPLSWNQNKNRFEGRGLWHLIGHKKLRHSSGLVESYPVWIQQEFKLYVEVLDNGNLVRLQYEQPISIDLQRETAVLKMVEKNYLRNPGQEVIDALFDYRREYGNP